MTIISFSEWGLFVCARSLWCKNKAAPLELVREQ